MEEKYMEWYFRDSFQQLANIFVEAILQKVSRTGKYGSFVFVFVNLKNSRTYELFLHLLVFL